MNPKNLAGMLLCPRRKWNWVLLLAFLWAMPVRAQFRDDFNDPAVRTDPQGINGWSFFTGDGKAAMDFRQGGPGFASIFVDASRDRRNVWWALIERRVLQGIDLGRVEDRMRMRRLCQITQPDLLVVGPAYKMYLGGSNQREEDLARIVASALDGLREEFGFALILEHHMPKAGGANRDLAPIGSSLWMRWPEFGLGLKLVEGDGLNFNNRQAEIIAWRGGRDDRPWPQYLSSGGAGELPWIDKVGR